MSGRAFSVIVPLYNKRDSVAATLRSILAQTHREFELIVVDDGSTDGSADAVAAFDDPRIVLVRQPNGGVARARNAGRARARHDYLAFIDADDRWTPDFLAEIDALIDRYPDAGIYCTRYLLQTSAGPVAPPVRRLPAAGHALLDSYFDIGGSGPLLIATGASCCIAAAAFDAAGGFPAGERLGEDQQLWCSIALRRPVAFRNKVCALYDVALEGRATARHLPDGELPFSRRLQARLDAGTVPPRLRRGVRRYIGAHLTYVGALNVRAGRQRIARRVLWDRRCCRRPTRQLGWLAVSCLKSCVALLRRGVAGDGSAAAS